MEDILLDDYGDFVAAVDGDMETVTDLDCLIQDIKHRLLTFPGDLWTDRTYGTGLQWFLQAEDTELNRLELMQLIKTSMRKEKRIKAESVQVNISAWDRDKISVRLSFAPSANAYENDGGTPAAAAAIVLTISQEGIAFGGTA